MLRLDPAHPPLWRSPTQLQFGVEPVARLSDPAPWQERLIRELEQGLPREALEPVALTLGAPAGGATALIAMLAPALQSPVMTLPARVILQIPVDLPAPTVHALTSAIQADGIAATLHRWPERAPEPSSSPVIVVAQHLVHPQRAAALVSADVPHLPLVMAGSGVTIGPLIIPGRTACLSCLAVTAAAVDPGWPVLAAQLAGRRAWIESPLPLVGEAAHRAVRLLSGEGMSARGTIELILSSASPQVRMRHHRPVADCGCRSPAGIGTGGDPVAREPTTARASARPA